MQKFINELKNNKDVNFKNWLANRIDIDMENAVNIDYVIERLEHINLLKSAYINEIEVFIENEKEYDSVKANENGVLDYLNSLNDDDFDKIADEMINDDWFNEKLNETLNEYIYHYKDWYKEEV